MKADKLIDAIGEISDEKIQNAKAEKAKIHKFPFKRTIAIVAAVIICLTVPVPVLAAAIEIEPVYQIMYHISPSLAQKLKPVKMSCTDQGIKMEVESAYIYKNEAVIVVSMQDLEGDRIDGMIDIYDTYNINRPFDCAGTCSRLDYDEESGKVTFLITISQTEGGDIGGNKITFSVGGFLSNVRTIEDKIPIDLSDLEVITETENRDYYYDNPYEFEFGKWEVRESPCIIPSQDIDDFIDGIDLTGYGYIDGKFHIQIAIPNRLDNDNHGYFYLVDKNGDKRHIDYCVDWYEADGPSNKDPRIDYFEYVFDIPQEEIVNYELYGLFILSDGTTKGNWQVTFPLENME